MRNNAEVNYGLCHQAHGNYNTFRQPHTINNSTQQRTSRTLCHQHRSNRGTTHSKLLDGSTQQEESQHQNLHGLFKWEKHGNTDWIIKDSETHRVETSLYPTTGAQRRRANPQDQHSKNPADIFTKYVATETLSRHLNEAGMNTQPYGTQPQQA